MTKQIICTALAVFVAICIKAQGFGEIQGKVLDVNGNPIPGVLVVASNGVEELGEGTNSEGKYRLNGLRAGNYNVLMVMMGMDSVRMSGVVVNPDLITVLDEVKMKEAVDGYMSGTIDIIEYTVPLIRKDGDNIQTLLAEDLIHRPTTHGGKISTIVTSMSSDFKPAAEGGGMSVRGSREGSVLYFIDGVKVRDSEVAVPASGISSVSVYSGGIPAKYGDTTSGVVIVNTKSYTEEYYKKLIN